MFYKYLWNVVYNIFGEILIRYKERYKVGLECGTSNRKDTPKEHSWMYAELPYGSAPRLDDDERHVVDMVCSNCGKKGVEVYIFEGIEEINNFEK